MIKLTEIQQSLIRRNIKKRLIDGNLRIGHGNTHRSLCDKGLISWRRGGIKFTDYALQVFRHNGINIDGPNSIRYLRLDPNYLRWKKADRAFCEVHTKWMNNEISDKEYDKLDNYADKMYDNCRCISRIVKKAVGAWELKIPKTLMEILDK